MIKSAVTNSKRILYLNILYSTYLQPNILRQETEERECPKSLYKAVPIWFMIYFELTQYKLNNTCNLEYFE